MTGSVDLTECPLVGTSRSEKPGGATSCVATSCGGTSCGDTSRGETSCGVTTHSESSRIQGRPGLTQATQTRPHSAWLHKGLKSPLRYTAIHYNSL